MTLFLVKQLRFTRSELVRGLEGLTDADARRRIEPMNSISWMIGHLAWQENRYWLKLAQSIDLAPELDPLVGYGRPASTPPLEDMWMTWRGVTTAADPFLDSLTPDQLVDQEIHNFKAGGENIGTRLLRVIYHYWYHIGEALAVRQMLGHSNLPDFVGDLGNQAPYGRDHLTD